MSRRRSEGSIGSAFVFHKLEMRRSPAWRLLPDHARRILDRLEVEHMEHGGAENGKLVCTFTNFEEAGVPRKAVALAIRQAEALGFVRIERGHRSAAQFRSASNYRLTYVKGRGRHASPPTNEWEAVSSDEAARTALDQAALAKRYETQPTRPKLGRAA